LQALMTAIAIVAAVWSLLLADASAQPIAPPPSPASAASDAPPAAAADQPATAAEPPAEPPIGQPIAPSPPPFAAPEPFSLDGTAYDAAVRATSQSAERLQGPLDGGWTLRADGDAPLYRFQFVDPGLGLRYAEAAWRDLRSSQPRAGSGFVSTVAYDGEALTLRFDEAGPDDLVVVTLKSAADGWTGELWRGGVVTPVSLRR
jgi:hypothetical protein